MIIGTDLLKELGITFDFANNTIVWEDNSVPMREKGTISNIEKAYLIHSIAHQPASVSEIEQRYAKILDSDYSKWT